ncbi:hypothetical protein [Pseudomonas kulmbachensis]|uniref:hypothetical protein n=1 Tax=Pseudomonas kulmbachensis TaxID=3043408 RepID=UPI002AAF42A8|nr:hypothetical protein [Pseudomonas sp. V3/3/4/13]
MVIKLLETISATFMLTAAAYAAGVVQSKEMYRELGVEPELVSIDFQKALYDGGLLVFSELAKDFSAIAPYFFVGVIACVIGCFFSVIRSWIILHSEAVLRGLSVLGYVVLLWVIYDVTVSSFGRGRELGGKLAIHLQKECTLASVKFEGGISTGLCAVGRTTDLLWFYDPKSKNSIAFGKDKILKVVVGG